uniref:Uncharacterized protein n=1 Tax=Trichogramma kaykai TaxID=54128 RepID=A0ABD2WQX4_9HYME
MVDRIIALSQEEVHQGLDELDARADGDVKITRNRLLRTQLRLQGFGPASWEPAVDGEDEYNINSEISNLSKMLSNLNKLKTIRDKVICQMEHGGANIIDEIQPIIRNWEGPYPDLGKLFRRKEMD